MTTLRFAIASVCSEPQAAAPTLVFRIVVDEPCGVVVQAALLRCQIYIDVRHRRYSAVEAERLSEMFGERVRWCDTMCPLIWATVPLVLSRCQGSIAVDVPISCSHDFQVASSKYFRAIDGGDVPLLFTFSGTFFTAGPSALQVSQVPWDTETRFGLPVRIWRDAMDAHVGDSPWLRLSRNSFDALDRFRRRRGFLTWDELVGALCADEPLAELASADISLSAPAIRLPPGL